MADDFDVEAMLEAPYRNREDEGRNERDSDRSHERRKSGHSRDKDRRRSRSRDRDRERDRIRNRPRDGERHRDRDRHRRDSPERYRRSRSRERHRRENRRKSPSPIRVKERERVKEPSMPKDPFSDKNFLHLLSRPIETDLTPEERDARTVFCMQLAARIRPKDLEEFFSSVGKVKDCRIITDSKTRRSKGIAYIEFKSAESVPLALGLTGQKLLGIPIIVQASQAEKNRVGLLANSMQKGMHGPMRLYVGSLHFNITEDMLRGIFEPFGKIIEVKLMRNHETNRSQGYGFISFQEAEDAKKALEQLNGFELAGRPMKVGHVTERTTESIGGSMLDSDEMDRAGIDLGATGRLQLMAKLAEGSGFELPPVAANALNMTAVPTGVQQVAQSAPPIATQCFMLSNMFDPTTETSMTWDQEIRDDVIDECNKHGGVLHIFVDKASPQGNVYVKCPSISAAVASVQALHGRWFAGKMITAAYVPLPNYHQLFPDAQRAVQLVMTSSHAAHGGFAQSFGAV